MYNLTSRCKIALETGFLINLFFQFELRIEVAINFDNGDN